MDRGRETFLFSINFCIPVSVRNNVTIHCRAILVLCVVMENT